MTGVEWVLLAALVFCLFAMTIYELRLGRVEQERDDAVAHAGRLLDDLFEADRLARDMWCRIVAQS